MSDVTLSDLKRMGNLGGYTIRLNRKFPFSYTGGYLRRDYIEFIRLGIINGEKREVFIREPYSRELLAVIDSIMLNKTLVARRTSQTKQLLLTGKGYRHVN